MPGSEPLSELHASEAAYRIVRAAILDGTYPPNSKLGQVEVAESLGLSRTPVRDALRRLSSEGLIQMEAARSARVSTFTVDDIEQIYDIREMLDSYAARRAATRIDAKDLDAMLSLCDDMDAYELRPGHASYLDLVHANDQFHNYVHKAAGSLRFLELAKMAAHIPVNLSTFQVYGREERDHTMAHHRELVMALGAGDAHWAATVAAAHVQASRHAMINALRRSEPVD